MSTAAAPPMTRGFALERPPFDPWLLGAILGLTSIGIVMVYSSSAVYAGARIGDGAFFLKRQAVFAGLGILVMATLLKMGYRVLEKLAYPILALCFVGILLTFVPGLGMKAGGAQRWIKLFGMQFQPSEFAKVALCIYLAKSVSEKGEALKDFKVGFLPHMIVVGAFGGLVLAQPDFGSMFVMSSVMLVVLFVAGARMTYVFVALGAAVPVVYGLIVTSPYRRARIEAVLNPFEDRYGAGYQVAEALMSIGSGGLTGLGLGEGRQKLGYLPAGHTDYILASLGEELGLLGIAVVLGLFALLVVRGLRAARNAADPFGAYLAFGLTTLFAIETVINAGMCLALLPPKGIALPFLSYGGTSIMKGLAAGGMLLAISKGGGGYLTPATGATRCK